MINCLSNNTLHVLQNFLYSFILHCRNKDITVLVSLPTRCGPGSDLDVRSKPHEGSMLKALLITAVPQNRRTDRLSRQKWPATKTHRFWWLHSGCGNTWIKTTIYLWTTQRVGPNQREDALGVQDSAWNRFNHSLEALYISWLMCIFFLKAELPSSSNISCNLNLIFHGQRKTVNCIPGSWNRLQCPLLWDKQLKMDGWMDPWLYHIQDCLNHFSISSSS